MKHPLAGISLILFGILLVLFSLADPWVPVLGTVLTPIALWAGLACGVAGLAAARKPSPCAPVRAASLPEAARLFSAHAQDLLFQPGDDPLFQPGDIALGDPQPVRHLLLGLLPAAA